jgi:hypothetical protein
MLTALLASTKVKLPPVNFYRSQPFVNGEDYDEPWVTPGGLRGVAGWRSFTAASVPITTPAWVTGAQYADGQVFVDLLVNAASGKPFEVRVRRKSDGRWFNTEAFVDSTQAPVGYAGAGKCSSCHAAKSAPRAKDTVISFSR